MKYLPRTAAFEKLPVMASNYRADHVGSLLRFGTGSPHTKHHTWCGFASVEQGNLLIWDEQRRKLELVVDTARKVWG